MRASRAGLRPRRQRIAPWPLHDIAIANIVWYILQSQGVGGNIILRNSVGDDVGGGAKQRVGAQRIVLIRAQKPRNKTISCIGQIAASDPFEYTDIYIDR